jgi:uncharacterized protein YjbI with pentapeptide repeats
MSWQKYWLACALVLTHTSACPADIFRWDNGQVIPGTEGITPGPDVHLENQILEYADLREIDLTSAIFTGANLTSANFVSATLTKSNLRGANLANAVFYDASLANADLTGAIVTGASFAATTYKGLTKEQLYSTASYRAKDLHGIVLSFACVWDWCGANDLTGWDLSDQNLEGANLSGAEITDTDLSGANLINANFFYTLGTSVNLTGADTRGALVEWSLPAGEVSRNAISPDGKIAGLELDAGSRMVVRDDDGGMLDPGPRSWIQPRLPIPVSVQDHLIMAESSILQLAFDADPWDSLISFEPGIPVELAGAIQFTFADDVDVASQVGRTLQIFDWTGVAPSGQCRIRSPYIWDITNLYTSGEVTLVAVPEPTFASIFLVSALVLGIRRRVTIRLTAA